MERVNKALRRVPPWVFYLLGILPAVTVVVPGLSAIDPVRSIEWGLGLWALRLVLLSLAVTPLRWVGLNLLRFRRQIGLVAFAYVALHFASWLTIDMGFRWGQIGTDLVRRWYIVIGMGALLLLIPLAITSNDASIRRLRGAWGRLHKLVYPAAILAMVHASMVGKVWTLQILAYVAVLSGLMAVRIWKNGVKRVVWA